MRLSQIIANLLNDLVQLIQGIPASYMEVMDSFCIGDTGNAEFSTKFMLNS